jgi:hypothetical protein
VSDDDQPADDDQAADLLDDIDIRSVSIIWTEHDERPEVCWSGCSVYEAIGLTVVGMFRMLGAEAWHPDGEDDDEEEDE